MYSATEISPSVQKVAACAMCVSSGKSPATVEEGAAANKGNPGNNNPKIVPITAEYLQPSTQIFEVILFVF
ncbi:hypothetical protein D0A37_13335 [Microcoleus vaginatus HSN003]|nr:hypothetical protein D0A37_13335 [Microcoleus vaginatus HSN003]